MSLLNNFIDEIDSSYNDVYRLDLFPPIIPLEEIDEIYPNFPFTECKSIEKIKVSVLFDVPKMIRREKEDCIRKRIKTFFHKFLREIINKKLKEAGSEYFFECFPQNFMADITKKTNYEILELTFEEIIEYTYQKLINDKDETENGYIKKRNEAAIKKYAKNIKTLEYLNSNQKISEDSCWERIKRMTYKNLLKAYFNSDEFQKSVEMLPQKETKYYIKLYLYFSSTYIEYFSSYNKNSVNNRIPNYNYQTFPRFLTDEVRVHNDDLLESIFSSRNSNYISIDNNSLFREDNNLFEIERF